jgi:hypothetical protein
VSTYRVTALLRTSDLRIERRTITTKAPDPVSAEWILEAELDRMGQRPLGRIVAVRVSL